MLYMDHPTYWYFNIICVICTPQRVLIVTYLAEFGYYSYDDTLFPFPTSLDIIIPHEHSNIIIITQQT